MNDYLMNNNQNLQNMIINIATNESNLKSIK